MRKKIVSAFLIFFTVTFVSNYSFCDEKAAGKYLENVKNNHPELILFLKNMPKGADLHSHTFGAIYGESYLDAAVSANLYYDPKQKMFFKENAAGRVPAKEFVDNPGYTSQFMDIISMRGSHPATSSGRDHFFNSFNYMETPSDYIKTEALYGEILLRARAQNLQYLELMAYSAPFYAMTKSMQNPPPIDNYDKAYDELAKRFPEICGRAKKYLDNLDVSVAKYCGFKAPVTGIQNPITLRYIYTAYRLVPNDSFFSAIACGMALMKADKRIAALNIIGPEDDISSRKNFETQMKIVDYLWKKMGKPNITLHAGELTLELSPVEVMRSRIRKSIEVGHAQRIGHGVSIGWEDNCEELLNKMKKERVAVEVCFSSNDGILKITGNKHPFMLYRKYGVPVTINTDDEGVNRSNITNEYTRAVESYNLSYKELKEIAKNSIEYSFLPGISLYIDGDYNKLLPEFKNIHSINWKPDEKTSKIMLSSEKLTKQVQLERAFVEFEDKYK